MRHGYLIKLFIFNLFIDNKYILGNRIHLRLYLSYVYIQWSTSKGFLNFS